MEGTMANLEKHRKQPLEEFEQADFSTVPTRARSPHVVGNYIKNRQHDTRHRAGQQNVLLRMDDIPATPTNIERLRVRIRKLNHRLADSGTPFRIRMI